MTETGTYVLLLQLPVDEQLTIGKLGTFDFPAGWYTYVGSAFGSGGLVGRLKHHMKPVEKPHWHIDYLRQSARLMEIWLSPNTERHEEEWVDLHHLPIWKTLSNNFEYSFIPILGSF